MRFGDSVSPYRFKITGRTKSFINAFGEEVVVENAERAIGKACEETGASIMEYTVAPVYIDRENKGRHEWLIEFERPPANLDEFMKILDQELQDINSDYEAKRSSSLSLDPPLLRVAPRGTFKKWLKPIGKLGGQHKVPRLSNDREMLERLLASMEQVPH